MMQSAILNLEQGEAVTHSGRLIFYVTDVHALWNHLKDRRFDPEIPRDPSWGECYFQMLDPGVHELFRPAAPVNWRKASLPATNQPERSLFRWRHASPLNLASAISAA